MIPVQVFLEATQCSACTIIQSKLTLQFVSMTPFENTMLLSNFTNQSSRLEKVLPLAFWPEMAWRRAYKPRASHEAVSTGTWHEQHLFQFTNSGVQHSLLLFSLGSPPLLHLLDLSLVLNLVRWHLITNEMLKTNWLISTTRHAGFIRVIMDCPHMKTKRTRKKVLSNVFKV